MFDTKLTNAQIERLSLLIEECSETIQAATKILRHGFESYSPFDESKTTNKKQLEYEIANIKVATSFLENEDLDKDTIKLFEKLKAKSVHNFLHFQVKKDYAEACGE